jgi:hypothetical protein
MWQLHLLRYGGNAKKTTDNLFVSSHNAENCRSDTLYFSVRLASTSAMFCSRQILAFFATPDRPGRGDLSLTPSLASMDCRAALLLAMPGDSEQFIIDTTLAFQNSKRLRFRSSSSALLLEHPPAWLNAVKDSYLSLHCGLIADLARRDF